MYYTGMFMPNEGLRFNFTKLMNAFTCVKRRKQRAFIILNLTIEFIFAEQHWLKKNNNIRAQV